MVHLDKVEGQTGAMTLHEDGTIIASSGDLSNSEHTARSIQTLLSHTLPVEFTGGGAQQGGGQNGYVNATVVPDNGNNQDANNAALPAKWSRITVSFGSTSYVTCLSNKRIHVIKKESKLDSTTQPTDDE